MNCSKFVVLQWNCRSIEKNMEGLIQHISEYKYDVLSLQSLNVKKEKLPRLCNYFYPPIYQVDTEYNKVYTALYIKNDINYVECTSPVPTGLDTIHSCAIKISIDKKPLTIVSIYLPKGPDNHNTEWFKHLKCTNNNNYLLTGDFNAHSPFWEKGCNNTSHNRFLENIVDSPLYLLNDGSPTRFPDNPQHKSTSIDLTFISPDFAPVCNWQTYHDCLNSDHLPIIISLNLKHTLSSDKATDKVLKFNYKLANWNPFIAMLSNFRIDDDTFKEKDIEDLYDIFRNELIRVAKACIPIMKTQQKK